jgi:hypothetical protein
VEFGVCDSNCELTVLDIIFPGISYDLYVEETLSVIEQNRLCTVPVQGFDTPTHSRVFLYFYYFLQCTIIVKTSKLCNNTYEIMQ